jgi:hypothetical protein
MTSGNFQRIPLDQITVVREERLRRKISPKYIQELAVNIRQIGPIHPPVVSDLGGGYFKLISGECRFEAYKLLGWDAAMFQVTEEQDYLVHRAVELAENVKREDVTWKDQREFVTEWHEIKLSQDPSWTQVKTGLLLGLSQGMVSKYLALVEEVRKYGNTKIFEQDNVETAINMMERDQQRREDKVNFPYVNEDKSKRIITADFTEWVRTYDPPKDGPRFNFLHCDFPYGIGSHEMHQGSSRAMHGDYDDSEETYWHLLEVLCANEERLCTDSAHIMFWFSMHHYHDTLEFFKHNSDFEINPFPLVWHKSDGVGLLPDPQRGPRRTYETCLFGSRGDRRIVKSKASSFAAPTDRTQHMSIKPEPVLDHFFQMFVDQYTVMLDPTCGSGSAVRSAEALRATHILGIEKDPEFAERAAIELEKSRLAKPAA